MVRASHAWGAKGRGRGHRMGLGALPQAEHLDGMPAADCGWSPGLGLYLGVRWAHRGQGGSG